jgi:hypothetical protein
MVMDTVRIADLKARLSERRPLTVRSPRPGAPPLARVPLPPALRLKVDTECLRSLDRSR